MAAISFLRNLTFKSKKEKFFPRFLGISIDAVFLGEGQVTVHTASYPAARRLANKVTFVIVSSPSPKAT